MRASCRLETRLCYCEFNLEAPEERGTEDEIEEALVAQETERIAEEERLAIELEEQRQIELAGQSSVLQKLLKTKPQSWSQSRPLKLRSRNSERLEREGAKLDVQIS